MNVIPLEKKQGSYSFTLRNKQNFCIIDHNTETDEMTVISYKVVKKKDNNYHINVYVDNENRGSCYWSKSSSFDVKIKRFFYNSNKVSVSFDEKNVGDATVFSNGYIVLPKKTIVIREDYQELPGSYQF